MFAFARAPLPTTSGEGDCLAPRSPCCCSSRFCCFWPLREAACEECCSVRLRELSSGRDELVVTRRVEGTELLLGVVVDVDVGGGSTSSGIRIHRRGGERQSQQLSACSSPPFSVERGEASGREWGRGRRRRDAGDRGSSRQTNVYKVGHVCVCVGCGRV